MIVRRSAFSAREDTTEMKVFFDSGVDAAGKCKPRARREVHRDRGRPGRRFDSLALTPT